LSFPDDARICAQMYVMHRMPDYTLNFYRNVNSWCTRFLNAFFFEVAREKQKRIDIHVRDTYCTCCWVLMHSSVLHPYACCRGISPIPCMANSFLYWKAGKGRNLPKWYKERDWKKRKKERRKRKKEKARNSFSLHYTDWILNVSHFLVF